ncbi:MAG: UDP-N-acetylmuramoyl-L-alanine--D-glutamate ligase [Thiohalomonadales bacterium]
MKHKIPSSLCLENSNILVVGLGKTGASIIEYLLKKKLSFRVLDSRENPPNFDLYKDKVKEIVTGGLFEKHFIWADIIILSPGISENEQVIKNARANGKLVVGDIELFLNEVKAPVVAITGSNGKSTVTSMMDSIGLYTNNKISIGGNIGIPALDLLQRETDLFVLELSSFQLETIESMNFVTSVILNLSEDHMDRYDSFENYCKAKLKLLKGNGNFILNFDDSVIRLYSELYENKKNVYWFTLNRPIKNQFGIIKQDGSKWICVNKSGELIKLLNCSELNVFGDHNISNAMVALMISRLFGIDSDKIKSGLTQFKGLPHRSQLVIDYNDVKWINDSKATNVGATIAAISGFKRHSIILIMGGQSKGQDFSKLNSVINSNVKLIILFGEDAEIINKALDKKIARKLLADLKTTICFANKNVIPGDIVLFSPGCASFDMFDNFEQRGDSFNSIVKEITL